MPNDWRSVRITFLCSPDIDPAGAGDLLVKISHLVREHYPDQVRNVGVSFPDTPDFFGRNES